MMIRELMQDRQTAMSIGMLALILGSVCHFFLHPSAGLPQDLADGITGVMFGISIGCNLLSLRRARTSLAPHH